MPTEPHECAFVEEQEPNGRLILCPCLVCGLSAMDAMADLKAKLPPVLDKGPGPVVVYNPYVPLPNLRNRFTRFFRGD